LWVAIALLKKELEEKTKLIEIAVKPWKSIVEMGEIEKRKTIERIVTDLLQPKDKDQKEIVDKLVESLMKF
jgi:uroporphyrinogen-III decarboxylase